MNLFNMIKVNLFYKELKPFSNMDIDSLFDIPDFKNIYDTLIKDFLLFLDSYSLNNLDKGKYLVFLSKLENRRLIEKYINYLKNVDFSFNNLKYVDLFKDDSFENIMNMFKDSSIPNEILDIVRNGYADRYVYLYAISNGKINQYSNLKILEAPYWELFKYDFPFGDITFLAKNYENFALLDRILEENIMEQMKWCYENIPCFEKFANYICNHFNYSSFQFDKDFINSFDIDILNVLYDKGVFYDSSLYTVLENIYQNGNIDLIVDLINFDRNDLNFKQLKKDEYGMSLLESSYYDENKNRVFVSKYFGIDSFSFTTYEVILDSFSCIKELSDELKIKYGDFLELLNYAFYASKEDLIKLSHTYNFESVDYYKNLLVEMEHDLNNFIRKDVTSDLNERDVLQRNNTSVSYKDGVEVHEFEGCDFTMLVHAISYNPAAFKFKDIASILIDDPSKWDSFDSNQYISTSIINQDFMSVYGVPEKDDVVVYGFSNLVDSDLVLMGLGDLGIKRDLEFQDLNFRDTLFKNCNTVVPIDRFMDMVVSTNSHTNNPGWNEVVLRRKRPDTGLSIKPDYILCMDYISQGSINAAKYFNIPIYRINRKYYKSTVFYEENLNIDEEEVKSL